jgi:omega-amidase
MRIGAAQIDVAPGNPGANLEKVASYVGQAGEIGCDLVVFPELVDTGYVMAAVAETASDWSAPGSFVAGLCNLAKSDQIEIVCGVAERTDDGVYDSVVAVDAEGEIKGRYRKAHLFSVAGEDEVFLPGDELVTVPIGGFDAALFVCYDLRFPIPFRRVSLAGAGAFFIASAFPFPRLSHWEVLNRARAVENQAFVVAANRVGVDGDLTFCGASCIVDPFGQTKAAADEVSEELIYADLDPHRVAAIREAIPVLTEDRSDLLEPPR